ncbi:hypothetical protein PENSPDRAFT_451639 [Peniophora sp. CONT]|nr:hypothetical protein PENSPDRAFT_451639 [Peniophora sp. CONT]
MIIGAEFHKGTMSRDSGLEWHVEVSSENDVFELVRQPNASISVFGFFGVMPQRLVELIFLFLWLPFARQETIRSLHACCKRVYADCVISSSQNIVNKVQPLVLARGWVAVSSVAEYSAHSGDGTTLFQQYLKRHGSSLDYSQNRALVALDPKRERSAEPPYSLAWAC